MYCYLGASLILRSHTSGSPTMQMVDAVWRYVNVIRWHGSEVNGCKWDLFTLRDCKQYWGGMNGPGVTWGRPSLPLASMPQRGGATASHCPACKWNSWLPDLWMGSDPSLPPTAEWEKPLTKLFNYISNVNYTAVSSPSDPAIVTFKLQYYDPRTTNTRYSTRKILSSLGWPACHASSD